MEYTFYIESNFRRWRDVNYLKFQIPDGTEFILSEEWLVALQRNRRTPMQRLIFLKRNNYSNIYRVTVEVSSASNRATGKIVLLRETKAQRTSIIVLLSDFQQLRYPVQDKVTVDEVEVCERVIYDTFKYKITIIRLNEQQSEIEITPGRDTILILSNQLESLLANSDFSDVIITDSDGNYQIQAHRNILVARSKFFKCMFQNNWKENKESRIVLFGIHMEVVRELLHYIYSGVVRSVKFSVMFDLYKEADKFLMEDLKEMLSKELRKHLNAENAVGVFMLGHFYKDINLKLSCLEVIRHSFDKIQNTVLWKSLQTEEEYSKILDYSEILETILQNIN